MLKAFWVLAIAVAGTTVLADPVKFNCFQGYGASTQVFEGGYRTCDGEQKEVKEKGEKSKICVQSAMCVVATDAIKRRVLQELLPKRNVDEFSKKLVDDTWAKLDDGDVARTFRVIFEKTRTPYKQGDMIAPFANLVCKADGDQCPPPEKCKGDIYYNILHQEQILDQNYLKDFSHTYDSKGEITK
jgi:hypothetical protein